MKKIFFTIFISIIFLGPSNLLNKVYAKEITNLQWKKSVAKGKKLNKFRETVTSPASVRYVSTLLTISPSESRIRSASLSVTPDH